MKLTLLLGCSLLAVTTLRAQHEECGTMPALEHLRKIDPMVDQRMAEAELKMRHWVKDHPTGIDQETTNASKGIRVVQVKNENANRHANQNGKQKISSDTPCPYDNSYYETVSVPTVVNQSVITQLFGGEYSTAQGFVAGSRYSVSTCNSPGQFDSQMAIYPVGGGNAALWDDDGCGTTSGPSYLEFTVTTGGDFDILLDQYNCADNFDTYMDVAITLLSTGSVDTSHGNTSGPPLITIPVVFHVIYKDASQNLSDQRIQSQLTVLNALYRKTIADTANIPSVFLPLAADFQIEFCLASKDPGGQPTSGITRTQTTVDVFGYDDPVMKSSAHGGHDNWDPQHYLNIWACNLGTELMGFATFPDELTSHPELDGVVINSEVLGVGGNIPHYNIGRTCAHEVGHWLFLRHIWGDASCGDDLVADTPTQDQNSECPTFPHVSCSNGPNGDIIQDIMDYVYQDCRIMFTQGQKTRAWSTINTLRQQLTQSQGCLHVGIDEENFSDNYIVYPNPAHGEIVIESPYSSDPVSIEIYNTLGEKIISDFMTGDKKILNVSTLTSGIYVISFSNDKVRGYKKIVVN